MSRFIEEASRSQGVLLPETIEEYVAEENPVRVIDAFVALHTGSEYLIQSTEVSYTPSLSVLQHCLNRPSAAPAAFRALRVSAPLPSQAHNCLAWHPFASHNE